VVLHVYHSGRGLGSCFEWQGSEWQDLRRLGALENIAQMRSVVHEDSRWIITLSRWNLTWIPALYRVVWYLGYSRVCTQWAPCLQAHTYKGHCVSVMLEHLQWYHTEGDVFLQQILVGGETWCCHFKPIGKPAGLQWSHPNNNFMSWALAVKVRLSVFLDIERTMFL
jgi:hypothetical protein